VRIEEWHRVPAEKCLRKLMFGAGEAIGGIGPANALILWDRWRQKLRVRMARGRRDR
jgi:hypothetical protein